MSSSAKLYSPEVLALATSLAGLPLGDDLPLRGTARSQLCGSTIEIGLEMGPDGTIARIGIKVHACAIGQASAAIFAQGVIGRNSSAITESLAALEHWLSDPQAAQPDWPGLNIIAAARDYPARHGALLLPWKAALAALP